MKQLIRYLLVLLLAAFGGSIVAATILGYRRPVVQYLGRQPVIGVVFDRGQFCTFVGEVRVHPPAAAPTPRRTVPTSVIRQSTVRARARTFPDEAAAYATRPRMALMPGQKGVLVISGSPTQGADVALGDRYQLVYTVTRRPDWWIWGLGGGSLAGAAALMIVPLVRRRRRDLTGLCRACGYDLRATPDRCPECGQTVVSRPATR